MSSIDQYGSSLRTGLLFCLSFLVVWNVSSDQEGMKSIQSALTFHASFDTTVNADWAVGDPHLYHVSKISERSEVNKGLPANDGIRLVEKQGVVGGALRFNARLEEVVYFNAKGNMAYKNEGWDGAVSLWLKLSPDTDLAPGFTDPLLITPRAWNDAALWVDFSRDERPRHFRMGVFEDKTVWNPDNTDWNDVENKSEYMVTVEKTPFNQDRWTHVLINFSGFNSQADSARAGLYLDGRHMGTLSKSQKLNWDIDQTRIMIGIYYTGWLDELSIFNRALTPSEITRLSGPDGVGAFPR